MKYKTYEDFMDRLRREVKKTVNSYETDFTEHDMKTFAEFPGGKFLWMTRSCGTLCFPLTKDWTDGQTKFLQAVINQNYKTHHWFILDFEKLEVRKLIDEHVQLFAHRMAKQDRCTRYEIDRTFNRRAA